jgi:hypothetical protein
MNDLQQYFELTDRVKELTESVCLLEQIKSLKDQVVKLNKDLINARKNASKHKRANDILRKKYDIKRVSRCGKARELISQRESGELDITLKAIADQCFLGYSTVKSLARDLRVKE